MTNELFFRLALLVLFVAFVAHRAYYTRRLGQADEETMKRGDDSRLGKLANLLAIPGLIAVAMYVINPAWMEWASVPLPTGLRFFGIAIALLGFALLQWSQNTLGANWSDEPRIRQAHTLITDGPYEWIRHPIYMAFLLIMASPFFISANWFIGLVWFGMTAIDVSVRVRTEEAMLESEFGEQYRKYEMGTGRLLPRLRRSDGG